jgi:hypothetical protein
MHTVILIVAANLYRGVREAGYMYMNKLNERKSLGESIHVGLT